MPRLSALLAILVLAVLALGAARADDAPEALDFGGDAYRAGGAVAFDAPGARDAFLAGERVRLLAPIDGSAHLAGRRIETRGAIGGALYAAGADLRIEGPVAGSATIAGYDVEIAGPIGGNLRVGAARIALTAPVEGSAILGARSIELAAPIAGDAMLSAERLAFGDGARVDGRLILIEAPGATLEVPASVAPPERIERRQVEGEDFRERAAEGLAALAGAFLVGVLVLGALATLAGALAPRGIDRLGGTLASGPARAVGVGFLALSTLVGAAILLAVTVIGLVVAPFAILAAILVSLLGYVVAVYLLGVWAITRTGALEPDSFGEHALAGFAGAAIASLVALVPFAGWLAVILLALAGVGAIARAAIEGR